jgi:hypothetical protein
MVTDQEAVPSKTVPCRICGKPVAPLDVGDATCPHCGARRPSVTESDYAKEKNIESIMGKVLVVTLCGVGLLIAYILSV